MQALGFQHSFTKAYRVATIYNSKISLMVLISFLMLLSAGCASRSMIKPEAFGTQKTFAIVSIAGAERFNSGSKSTKEVFTGYDDSNNTQPILDKMRVIVWKALKQSNHFKLANPQKVRSSKAYKELAADESVFRVGIFKTEMTTAKDYKYISNREKFAKLANELKVDGVIQVIVNLSTRDTKVYALGLGAKKTRVLAFSTLVAYDRTGNVIWQDMIQETSEDGVSKAMILVDTGNMNYKKLLPLAEKVSQDGINKIVDNLDNKMGTGKKTQRQTKG